MKPVTENQMENERARKMGRRVRCLFFMAESLPLIIASPNIVLVHIICWE